MPYKDIVKVKNDEKRLYQIMKELEMDGECLIDSMSPEWHSTMRKFGVRTKSIVNNDLLEKPWIQRNDDNVVHKRLFRIPKKGNKRIADVIEIPGNNISIFHFKRRKLI